jgi:7-cyano-7-deazaguanine synthase
MAPHTTPGKAVVLLSGGLDSATALAIAKAEGYELHAISFNYHQRHARELESARMIASSSGVAKHLVVDFDLREIGGSALTAEIEVPKAGVGDSVSDVGKRPSQSEPKTQKPIPITYVPARNTIFLSFALAWAEVLEAGSIFIGANAIDYSGYPDCRPEYLRAFEHMANLATRASVERRLHFSIEAPLVTMTKAEIIKKGRELGVDYSLTWSCYDPQRITGATSNGQRAKEAAKSEPLVRPCRRCDSCLLREKGFREAGIEDPLV